LLQWNTASEVGTLGFYIEREDPATGEWSRLNDGKLIPGLGLSDPQGGTYTYLDAEAVGGQSRRYRLIEIEVKGNKRLYGPYEVALSTTPDARTVKTASKSATPYTVTAKQPALATELQQQTQSRHMTLGAASAGIPDGMRIGIRETGLYHLSAAQIAATLHLTEAEVIGHISQQHLSLRNKGNEIAWLPADADAGLYFYAEAIDSIYTSDNVVLLTIGQGTVMATEDGGNPAPSATLLAIAATQHFEQDVVPAFSRAVGDYWYWGAVGNFGGHEQADFDFQLNGVAPGSTKLSLDLEGYSETAHVVKVELNGTDLGNLSWDGLLSYRASLAIPDGILQDGNNTLTLIHQSVPGQSSVYFNGFDVDYLRGLTAQGGQLRFEIQEQAVATISGFSSNKPRVLRIDSSWQPVLVENTTVGVSGAGYEVSFATGEDKEGRFIALENTAIHKPEWLNGYTDSGLATPANQADYLVIVPADLESGAQALAAYRAVDGLITKVVTLEDIYLAFNQGIEDPIAIQSFVGYARDHWLVAPRYVALAGDSSYDHRHILTNIRDDHKVPAIFVGTPDGLFAADNLYGAMRDGAPRVAVGRIPVRDNAALLEYVDKLQAWESSLTSDKSVQLVADNADPGAGDFPVDSNSLKPEVPPALLAATDVYLNPADSAQAHDDLLAALNEGRGLVNYLGHGGMDRLADEGILTTADVAALGNSQTPVMTALSCVVNRHAIAGVDNLGEQLVIGTDAGVVAMWAPTGLSQNASAVDLNQALLKAVYDTGHPVLGDAIVASLRDYAPSSQVRYMSKVYTLLGDPAVRIRPGSPLSSRIHHEEQGDIDDDLLPPGTQFGCTGQVVDLANRQFVQDQVCMATNRLQAMETSVAPAVEVTFCGPDIRLGSGFRVNGVFRAGANLCAGSN
jgi:hypothetical protein